MSRRAGPRNLLLTGLSGVGKSTLLKEVGKNLEGAEVRGFFSDAIWDGGLREGWRLDTFDGDGGVLAHSDIQSPHRMGRYGVDMALFERLVDSQFQPDSTVDVYLVDEIGIISSWSPKFVAAMDALLDSRQNVVAIIRVRGGGYVQQAKERRDVEVWEITRENHGNMLDKVLAWIARP